MRKNIIHFLSASDRLNYGDLLFPIIFENEARKRLGDEMCFYNYGVVESDLSHFGAQKTMSYKDLVNKVSGEGGSLVVGGGEVLFPTTEKLYSFIDAPYANKYANPVFGYVEDKIGRTRRKLCGRNMRFPFSPEKRFFNRKDIKIIYNAVGGGFYLDGNRHLENIAKKGLMDADYVSVRSEGSRRSLLEKGFASVLSPDSALLMSDYFSVEKLRSLVSDSSLLDFSDYLFVQIGKNKAPSDLLSFSDSLKRLSENSGLSILLCPIGIAPNHEDQFILGKVFEMGDRFSLVEPKNIYDIMFLLARSKGYMGTSLHGMITAQSFGVPFFPLNERVGKLDGYCKTWLYAYCKGCLSFDQIEDVPKLLANWNFEGLKAETKKQKELVNKNFDSIFRMICS